MRPLTQENIQSELSYAYLHAVASQAGVACQASCRHLDNAGIDATLVGWGPFPQGGYRHEVSIHVQLKATAQRSALVGDTHAYHLKGIQQYNDHDFPQ